MQTIAYPLVSSTKRERINKIESLDDEKGDREKGTCMSRVLAGFPGLHSDGTLITLAYLVRFLESSVLLSGFLKFMRVDL